MRVQWKRDSREIFWVVYSGRRGSVQGHLTGFNRHTTLRMAIHSQNQPSGRRPSDPHGESRPSAAASGASGDLSAGLRANYIKLAFTKAAQIGKLGTDQLAKLNQNQRIGAGIAAAVLLFWPLLSILILAPWILLAVIIGYSLMFGGFPRFVADLEEAIIVETNISEKVLNVYIDCILFFRMPRLSRMSARLFRTTGRLESNW